MQCFFSPNLVLLPKWCSVADGIKLIRVNHVLFKQANRKDNSLEKTWSAATSGSSTLHIVNVKVTYRLNRTIRCRFFSSLHDLLLDNFRTL